MVMGRADRVALPPQPTRPPPRQPPATQDIVLSCIAPDLGELRALEIKPVLRRGGLLFACVPDRVGEDRGVPLVCPPSMGFLAVFGTTEIREVPGFIDWSGRRGSNPRPRPWQGRAPASTPCRTALLLSIKRSRGSARRNTICNTNRKSDRAKNAKSTRFYWLSCGRRIVVIQQLPKLHTRVRFPSPAPALCFGSAKSTIAPDHRGNRIRIRQAPCGT